MALGCPHYILQPFFSHITVFAYDPLIFCGIPHMKQHQKSLFLIATTTADQAPWFFWEGEPTCFIKVFRGQHVMLVHIYNHLQFRQLMEWKIPQNMHSTWIGNSHGMGLFQALQTSTIVNFPVNMDQIPLRPWVTQEERLNYCQSFSGTLQSYFYPLVNVYIAMERSTIFHGKIHYFNRHVQLLG